jgi:hypothetical protein
VARKRLTTIRGRSSWTCNPSIRNQQVAGSIPAGGSIPNLRISTNGGDYPAWGPLDKDGRELFYVSPDDKLMSVNVKLGTDPVEPSTPRELFPLPGYDTGLGSPYDVTADGQRYLVRADQASQPLTVIADWPALLKKESLPQ